MGDNMVNKIYVLYYIAANYEDIVVGAFWNKETAISRIPKGDPNYYIDEWVVE